VLVAMPFFASAVPKKDTPDDLHAAIQFVENGNGWWGGFEDSVKKHGSNETKEARDKIHLWIELMIGAETCAVPTITAAIEKAAKASNMHDIELWTKPARECEPRLTGFVAAFSESKDPIIAAAGAKAKALLIPAAKLVARCEQTKADVEAKKSAAKADAEAKKNAAAARRKQQDAEDDAMIKADQAKADAVEAERARKIAAALADTPAASAASGTSGDVKQSFVPSSGLPRAVQYRNVVKTDPKELSDAVTDLLLDGWSLYGNPILNVHEDLRQQKDRTYIYMYVQALAKYK